MKKNLVKKLGLILLVILLIGIFFFNEESAYASSATISDSNQVFTYIDGEFDHYTDSDFLLGDLSNTIFTYKENCWQSQIEVNDNLNVLDDDPIVKIIPKEFFAHQGEYFYIGNEYAFFVKTVIINSLMNMSNVFIIDIERNYDLSSLETTSQVVHKIKPIFQSNFSYLNTPNSLEFPSVCHIINHSGKDNVVIPTPIVYPNSSGIHFDETNTYFLKDISFGAYLRNEQHKNIADERYDVSEDKGSFFIRSDLYYKGEGGTDLSNVGATIQFAIGTIVDSIAPVPIFTILDGIMTAKDLLVDASHHFLTENSYAELYKSTNYASAVEQIQHNGYLNKAVSVGLTSENRQPLLFGTMYENDYVTCKFTLGQTEEWYTRMDSSIKMSIVTYDVFSKTYEVISKTGYFTENIREKEYKDCQLETNVNGYALANGCDYFSYTPVYTGQYSIAVNKDVIVNVYDDSGTLLQKAQNSVCLMLNQNQDYKIKVENYENMNQQFLLNLTLYEYTLGKHLSTRLSANDSFICKIKTSTSDTYEMIHSGTDCEISLLDQDYNVIKSNHSNTFTYHFLNNKIYYILIENKTTASFNGLLLSKKPTSVELDNTYNYPIVSGDQFCSFVAPHTGTYYISVVNQNHQPLVIYKKGKNMVASATPKSLGNVTIYCIYLQKAEIIYFGFMDGNQINLHFNIQETSNVITWYKDGNAIDGNNLYLKQGESCNIVAKVGDIVIDNSCIYIPMQTQSVTFTNGILKVSKSAYPTISTDQPHYLATTGNTTDQIYFLYIYILVNLDVTIEPLENGEKLEIYWSVLSGNSLDKCIVNLEFKFKDGSKMNKRSQVGKEGYIEIFKDEFVHSISNMIATVSLVEIEYYQYRENLSKDAIYIKNTKYGDGIYDASENTVSIERMTFNTMFEGGKGLSWDPYRITNERHLNNIRYCATEYREEDNVFYYIQSYFVVMNNITLKNDWEPIDAIMKKGSIQGYNNENKSIIGMRISETKTNQSIGFIRQFHGGTISYLTFESGKIDVQNSNNMGYIGIGMIAGTASSGTIENCRVTGSYIHVGKDTDNYSQNGARNTYCGGIVGHGNIILNCYNAASIESFGYIGGISGYVYGGQIQNCTNQGSMTLLHDNKSLSSDSDNRAVGGIVGFMFAGKIQEVENNGAIIYYSNGQVKDKLLAPRMGYMVGKFEKSSSSNLKNFGSMSSENLQSFKEGGFLGIGAKTYNQERYANKSNFGEAIN